MRIIGQCNCVDFANIEHLANITENPEMLDVNTLSRKEKFAFQFLTIAIRKHIDWNLLRDAVKEVLFWGEIDDKVERISIRFVHVQSKRESVERFRQLWMGQHVQYSHSQRNR